MESVFFGTSVVDVIKADHAHVASARRAAAWWSDRDLRELYNLMFGPELKRSWFVLSYGSCPACKNSVPLYNWRMDAGENPWKVTCPHCSADFPTNDFAAYRRSGLDGRGVFDRTLADRSLLVNAEGSDFGVDDGDGFFDADGERYLFIAAYLLHGHWKQLLINGIDALSYAYLVTRERSYATRAAVMLYRISEVFPEFDFTEQGVMYEEERSSSGYVTYWVNTCHDIKSMAIGYDMICDAIDGNDELTAFLRREPESIHASIRQGIFEDALDHPEKYDSNPPDPAFVRIILKAVLARPRSEVMHDVDAMIGTGTRVDGLSGEKGLASYAALVPVKLTEALLLLSHLEGEDLRSMLDRYPALKKTYRFYIDTWYAERHYPGSGDCGYYAAEFPAYLGTLAPNHPAKPYLRGRDWFTWFISRYYDDPDLVRALWASSKKNELFDNDIFLDDNERQDLREKVATVIDTEGGIIEQQSTLYEQWRIGLLHSGRGKTARMVSIGYDSGANHCHHDALNINLFFHGENISPDFGYPPVNYGGWNTREVDWYRHPASHNLVVVDGQTHTNLPGGKFLRYPEFGKAELLQPAPFAQAIYADAREYAGIERFERLVGLIDISPAESYVIDVFRIEGGKDHAKFFRAAGGSVDVDGLRLEPDEDYGHNTIMKDFSTDSQPPAGWKAEFGPAGKARVRVPVWDFTTGASVSVCRSWVDVTRMNLKDGEPGNRVLWVPTLMVRRRGPVSTFVTVIAPYTRENPVSTVRRISTKNGSDVILELETASGMIDRIEAFDPVGERGERFSVRRR